MQYVRILDDNGDYVTDPQTGKPLRIGAGRFNTKQDAADYLKKIAQSNGIEKPKYCCAHGNCNATTHFREKVEMVKGRKSLGRSATWVSDQVAAHDIGCPGPAEKDVNHMPHNGHSLTEASRKIGENILFHLNINLGVSTRESFNSRSNDDKIILWRRRNQESHSYFSVSSLDDLRCNIEKIYETGDIDALHRTYIAHEGDLVRLPDFIVRNRAKDRMLIIGELKRQKPNIYAVQSRGADNFVFGRPRLVFFEAAQNIDDIRHPKNPQRVRGWRYDVNDGTDRKVFDQLNLNKTGLSVDDFSAMGALIIARPYIHRDQSELYPVVHWSIQGEDNIDLRPSKKIADLLCWNGQNIPTRPYRRPKQLSLQI